MGTTLNAVDSLGGPFRSVDEQVFVVPTGGRNEVDNQFFKIVFMLEGDSFHQVDAEEPIRFVSGDILVIPRLCRHGYWGPPGSGEVRLHALRLVFDPRRFPPLPGELRGRAARHVERDFAAFVRHHLRTVHHLPGGQDGVIRPLLTQLRQEAEQRAPGYRFRVAALLTEVVVHIVRLLHQASGAEASGKERSRAHMVFQAKEYLLKNLAADLDLERVARHLHVSSEHLARCFKRETGETVFAHLRQLRLERAKTYLLGSDRSIAEISELTGFSSMSLFSRNFKQYTGTSPVVYRQERWRRGTVSREGRVHP